LPDAVLDAWALIALLRREPGHERVPGDDLRRAA
jgi:hypothetical protein